MHALRPARVPRLPDPGVGRFAVLRVRRAAGAPPRRNGPGGGCAGDERQPVRDPDDHRRHDRRLPRHQPARRALRRPGRDLVQPRGVRPGGRTTASGSGSFTNSIVHFGFLHIAFNMFVLYQVGIVLEPATGHGRLATLYVVSVLGGAAGALLARPERAHRRRVGRRVRPRGRGDARAAPAGRAVLGDDFGPADRHQLRSSGSSCRTCRSAATSAGSSRACSRPSRCSRPARSNQRVARLRRRRSSVGVARDHRGAVGCGGGSRARARARPRRCRRLRRAGSRTAARASPRPSHGPVARISSPAASVDAARGRYR